MPTATHIVSYASRFQIKTRSFLKWEWVLMVIFTIRFSCGIVNKKKHQKCNSMYIVSHKTFHAYVYRHCCARSNTFPFSHFVDEYIFLSSILGCCFFFHVAMRLHLMHNMIYELRRNFVIGNFKNTNRI